MAIKISFTGAQGTGKTTILNALREDPEFKELFEFVTEVVRRLVDELGLKINKEGTVGTQRVIFRAYESLLERKNSFVSDRCIVDVYSYTKAGTASLPAGSKERSDFSNCLYGQYQSLLQWSQDMGLVFYFPIEFPIEDDSVRSTDVAYQKEIDENIKRTLDCMGIPYVTVSGTVEERVAIIKRVLAEQS